LAKKAEKKREASTNFFGAEQQQPGGLSRKRRAFHIIASIPIKIDA
jgi:hypothetical protein